MPYSYHKEGDKYVVTKKDTGKVVGHTKGTKEALNKYLAALHINANEGIVNEGTPEQEKIKTVVANYINLRKAIDDPNYPDTPHTYSAMKKVEAILQQMNKRADMHYSLLEILPTEYHDILNTNEGKTNEASTLTKVARKILRDKIRTPKEFATQVKALPDKTLIVWAKDAEKNKGIPNTPLAFQQKLVKIEMAKRGLTTNSTGMPFENKTNTMKKSELTNMIQEIIKEVINESSNTTPKHIIIAQLMGPDFFLSKKPESKWDEKDHELFNRLYKMASETGSVPKMTESADYDTAVAFRLVAKDNRDAALLALQKEIEKVTGPSGRFSKVKVTIIPSKGNPQDIIIKLNGPSAFSMGKDITAKDKTKAYTNPTIRNNFSKVSPYTPQLTKIS